MSKFIKGLEDILVNFAYGVGFIIALPLWMVLVPFVAIYELGKSIRDGDDSL